MEKIAAKKNWVEGLGSRLGEVVQAGTQNKPQRCHLCTSLCDDAHLWVKWSSQLIVCASTCKASLLHLGCFRKMWEGFLYLPSCSHGAREAMAREEELGYEHVKLEARGEWSLRVQCIQQAQLWTVNFPLHWKSL